MYKCDICNKEFKYKQNYIRHVNKKRACIKKKEDLFKCELCDKEFKRKDNYNRHYKEVHNDNLFNCQYCSKGYKTKYTKERHEINFCKLKPIGESTIINNHGFLNQGTVNNDNRVININLYGFTKEDFTKLPQNFINKILNRGVNSVENLVKYTNCNEKTPQFHNLLITNKKENFIHVFNGDKWEIANKKDTINNLIGNRIDYLIDKYYELKDNNETTPTMDRKIKLLIQAYEHNNEFLIKRVKEQLEILLYNSKDIIKNTKKITNPE
jgi:uncharacterized C2H2 Zn-finger protein